MHNRGVQSRVTRRHRLKSTAKPSLSFQWARRSGAGNCARNTTTARKGRGLTLPVAFAIMGMTLFGPLQVGSEAFGAINPVFIWLLRTALCHRFFFPVGVNFLGINLERVVDVLGVSDDDLVIPAENSDGHADGVALQLGIIARDVVSSSGVGRL
jgi:hypothetical protein